jgi:two-component system CheB/CheR fusion protein
VDDNRDVVESLVHLLNHWGHETRMAFDGQTAVELVRAFRPDAVILDLGMPGLTGYEIARRIRQSPGLDAVRLIALTGFGQDEDRRRSREAGFDYHLVKPVDPLVLQPLLSGVTSAVP